MCHRKRIPHDEEVVQFFAESDTAYRDDASFAPPPLLFLPHVDQDLAQGRRAVEEEGSVPKMDVVTPPVRARA